MLSHHTDQWVDLEGQSRKTATTDHALNPPQPRYPDRSHAQILRHPRKQELANLSPSVKIELRIFIIELNGVRG